MIFGNEGKTLLSLPVVDCSRFTLSTECSGISQDSYVINPDFPVIRFIPHNNIFMHPTNLVRSDGTPKLVSKKFCWFMESDGCLEYCVDNQKDFTEISNLGSILEKTADFMIESYVSGLSFNPFSIFGLRLDDMVAKRYSGPAELIYVDGIYSANEDNKFENICMYLDIFIGLNYGDYVRSNKSFKSKLGYLNSRIIAEQNRTKIMPSQRYHFSNRHIDGKMIECTYVFRKFI